jgi:hypothetical protein
VGPSEEEILAMGLSEVRNTAKEWNVSLEGCKDVQQWKERLVLHFKVQRGRFYDIKVSI